MKIPNLHPGGSERDCGIYRAINTTITHNTWMDVSRAAFTTIYNTSYLATWEHLIATIKITTEEIE